MALRVLMAAIAALILTVPAHADQAIAKHGGRASDAGAYHVEMVAKDGAIEVYVTDHHNKPIRAAGFKGVAILVIDGKSQRFELAPAGDTKLTGKGAGTLPKEPKGVVRLTDPKGKTVQARFN